MKYLIFIFICIILFVGCTSKEIINFENKVQNIQTNHTNEKKIQRQNKTKIELEHSIEISNEKIQEKVLNHNTIAIMYPSHRIGKYAKSTINTISAYLLHKNQKFKMYTFDTIDESNINIENKLALIKKQNISKVIALFTKKGFTELKLSKNTKELDIYFPLINKQEIITNNDNFIFGGISYIEQLTLLKHFTNDKNTMFYYPSFIGNKLKNYYKNIFSPILKIKTVKMKNNNFKNLVEDRKNFSSTLVLNTPIIQTSMILSQLTAFEIYPYVILSTQLNYTPLLIKLTQKKDRKNFIVANSISDIDSVLLENLKLLGSDVSYNWVNYSSLIGVSYLLNDNNIDDLIYIQILDNQVIYQTSLYYATSYGFKKIEN